MQKAKHDNKSGKLSSNLILLDSVSGLEGVNNEDIKIESNLAVRVNGISEDSLEFLMNFCIINQKCNKNGESFAKIREMSRIFMKNSWSAYDQMNSDQDPKEVK